MRRYVHHWLARAVVGTSVGMAALLLAVSPTLAQSGSGSAGSSSSSSGGSNSSSPGSGAGNVGGTNPAGSGSGASDTTGGSSTSRSGTSGRGLSSTTGSSRDTSVSSSRDATDTDRDYGSSASSARDRGFGSQARDFDSSRNSESARNSREGGTTDRSWQETRDAARGTSRDARESARDTARSAREDWQNERDASREGGTTRAERESWQDTRDAARETSRDARESARDTARSAREDWQDERDASREGGATRREREDWQDARDSARDTARSARDTARDTARSAREDWQDTRDSARDTFREGGDAARMTRDRMDRSSRDRDEVFSDRDERFSDRDARYSDRDDRFSDREERRFSDSARYSDRDSRMTDRSARSADRFTDRSTTDRDSYRSFSSSRSSDNFNVNNIRANDLGLALTTRNNSLLISNVISSGPLARAGFRRGDTIYSVNGTRVASQANFIRYLFAEDVMYERVPVVVYRSGEYQTVYVEPSVIVEQVSTVQADPLEQFGIVVDDTYSDQIVVTRVLQGTPAYYAGLRPGDVITRFQGRRLTAPDQFVSVVRTIEPGEIDLQVLRDRQTRSLSVDIPRSFTTERVNTFRRSYDLDNNANNRIDRQDIRMERREERRDGFDSTALPRANINVATPADPYVYPPGNTGVTVEAETPRRAPLRSLLPGRR